MAFFLNLSLLIIISLLFLSIFSIDPYTLLYVIWLVEASCDDDMLRYFEKISTSYFVILFIKCNYITWICLLSEKIFLTFVTLKNQTELIHMRVGYMYLLNPFIEFFGHVYQTDFIFSISNVLLEIS